MKLGRLYGYDLAISSWCSILATELVISEGMDLVTDMDSDVKKAMRPNAFGITFCLSHLS